MWTIQRGSERDDTRQQAGTRSQNRLVELKCFRDVPEKLRNSGFRDVPEKLRNSEYELLDDWEPLRGATVSLGTGVNY